MKDAIVDLTSERVDAIKEGIQKEIDAYSELIEKKKEELDAEKDLYDFQKGVANQQKEIADIERKLAALSSDNSASARAQRAKLQAELAEAQQELQDTYYDRSISDRQEALDKELESFTDAKEKEIEGWEEYLEDTNKVVSDGLALVKDNTGIIYQTLQDMGEEYSLSITDALTSPWEEGEYAIQSFSEKFGIAMSATIEELQELEAKFKETMSQVEHAGDNAIANVQSSSDKTTSATHQEPKKEESTQTTNKEETKPKSGVPSVGDSVVIKSGTTRWGSRSNNAKMGSWVPGTNGITVSKVAVADGKHSNDQVQLKRKGTIIGWANVSSLEGYAKGTTGVKSDQLALIDELGEELVIRPSNGRMTFLEKGTSVIPANMTENLMEWGSLDPSTMLERNRPQIAMSPSVVNNTMEISVDASVGELIHVDTLNGNNPAEIAKVVDKAWDKYMKELNAHIRRYANR
jgi:hypothetical protein